MSFEGGNPPDWHNVTQAAPYSHYNPPPPVQYNPGPSRRASMSGNVQGSAPPPAPPPDIFAGFPGPAVDAASQLARQFVGLMGYIPGLDVNQLVLQLLQAGVSDPSAAYEYMYLRGPGMTDDLRDAHKNAKYGMDVVTYEQRKDSMNATFMSVIGEDPERMFGGASAQGYATAVQSLYEWAFKHNWSQQQLLTTLQTDPRYAGIAKDEPWLMSGQGYLQASQTFSSIYGSAPVDTATLAAWFRFNTGTSQLSRINREAVVSAAPMASTSETR